jgi:DNA-binding SARP family transcriptional activator
VRLERKTAALLALLALQGELPRARLAGLLWPDSPEATARNNLRQLLRRMRTALGEGLVEGADLLALQPGVAVDVRGEAGAAGPEGGGGGALLEGLEYDDLPEFADWLASRREGLQGAQGQQEARELARLEAAGDVAGALVLARRAVEREPLSEEAHRRLMRLLYVSGDRGAALAAFERCKALLKRELDVSPLPETVALAREIAGAVQRTPMAPAARRAEPEGAAGAGGPGAAGGGRRIPLTVLRPPTLAGREREWALMEEAWAAGKAIMIGGPPGVGKTRLMQDFLNTHARTLFFAGRPGDRTVPYGTHARTYRQLLDALGNPPLPEWVRREMARILPSLGEAPPPMRDPGEKLRFFQAKVELHRLAIQAGFVGLGFDDLQYVDSASGEAGHYVLSQVQAAEDGRPAVRTVHCFRTGELSPDLEAIIRSMHEAGVLLVLDLAPLEERGVGALLSSLGVPGVEGMAGALAGFSGGNPLMLLETVKHLVETGAVGGDGAGGAAGAGTGGAGDGAAEAPGAALPAASAAGAGVSRALIAGRLERLGAEALQLARTLAVLGNDFSLELAGEVLQAGPIALATWWGELEESQVVRGEGFAHDLLDETVSATTPAAVAGLLHRRAAAALEARGAPPALVALHWSEGGEPARAVPLWRRAAEAARDALLPEQEAAFTARASADAARTPSAPVAGRAS